MELAVDWLAILVHHFECVTAITVHVTITIWGATIREEEGHLVSGFWTKGDEVPEHVRVLDNIKYKLDNELLEIEKKKGIYNYLKNKFLSKHRIEIHVILPQLQWSSI